MDATLCKCQKMLHLQFFEAKKLSRKIMNDSRAKMKSHRNVSYLSASLPERFATMRRLCSLAHATNRKIAATECFKRNGYEAKNQQQAKKNLASRKMDRKTIYKRIFSVALCINN